MSQPTKKTKEYFGYECGNGPRPPVPGEESHVSKMTTEGACGSTSATNRSESSFLAQVSRWQENLSSLLTDKNGVELFYNFVKEECGKHSIDKRQLDFYFVCEGLREHADENTIIKLTRAIR